MRSLTRSMGAAAVFETAAETPPTAEIISILISAYRLAIIVTWEPWKSVGSTYSGSPPRRAKDVAVSFMFIHSRQGCDPLVDPCFGSVGHESTRPSIRRA